MATYQYPIMVGVSTGWSTASALRGFALMATNDVPIATALVNQDAYPGSTVNFSNFYMSFANAPGTGVSRTINLYRSDIQQTIGFTISDPSTSASDLSHTLAVGTNGTAVSVGGTASATPAAAGATKWSIIHTNQYQHWLGTTQAALSNSAARSCGMQDTGGVGATEANVAQVAPEAGHIGAVWFEASAALTSTMQYTIQFNKNGIQTGDTFVINAANQGIGGSPTGWSWGQGDTISLTFTPANTPTAVRIGWGMEYISDVAAGNGVLLFSNNSSVSSSVDNFNNWYGAGAWNATEAAVQALGAPCTVTGMYAVRGGAPGAASSQSLTFRLGGSNTAATMTYAGSGSGSGITTNSWSGSVTVNQNDLINIATHNVTGTPTANKYKGGIVFAAPAVVTAATASTYQMMGVG